MKTPSNKKRKRENKGCRGFVDLVAPSLLASVAATAEVLMTEMMAKNTWPQREAARRHETIAPDYTNHFTPALVQTREPL